MFAAVEKFSGPAKILLGLIALTFVGFGASSVSSSSSDYIVKIGDRPITVQEVQRALQNAQASGNQNATEQAILQALQGLKVLQLQNIGGVFIAHFDVAVSFSQVLSALGASGLELINVRNITSSTRRFFVA